MIAELKISNLALIESLHLSFTSGLTVLTGETGAGKSIVLQALNLLAGDKASPSLIRTGAENAVVEALFEIAPEKAEMLDEIRARGFETDGYLVLKRILTGQGRSRYYINDSLATARLVGDLAENLIAVAGQHDHQQLLSPRRHIDFIDTVGELWPKRQKFAALYNRWTELKGRFKQMAELERDKEQRRDFLAYQCDEIRKADIKPAEDETLAGEKARLKASDKLTQAGLESCQLMTGALNDVLGQVKKNLEQMATLDPSLSALARSLVDVYYQLEDQAFQLRDYCASIPKDPSRLEEIEARLDLLQRLKRKYGASNGALEEILAYAEKAEHELEQLENMDRQRSSLEGDLDLVERQLLDRAVELSALRQKAARRLTAAVLSEIRSLNFEQAEFEVRFDPLANTLSDCDETGWDRPHFMFSANPGEPVKPLSRVASGGELSRLMLGLKCILAQRDRVETVIFDEVDAGIGGRAAEAVARKIKELAGHHQVLCITHLPQIASYADEHFIVSKSVVNRRTRTIISPLPREHRAQELARMLAGDSVTPQTLAYASELVERERKPTDR